MNTNITKRVCVAKQLNERWYCLRQYMLSDFVFMQRNSIVSKIQNKQGRIFTKIRIDAWPTCGYGFTYLQLIYYLKW